jgi:pimeloyl-ACP methyl ester carboxylesterase
VIIRGVNRPIIALAALSLSFVTPKELAAQFEYDSARPFDATCEQLSPRVNAIVRGCHFTGPRGGQLSFLLVAPKAGKPPFAGVVFQHGGGQSMFDYLSEALILARIGVVSIVADAPARGDSKESELNRLKLQEAKDFQAEIVITERRVLDFLIQQPGVDQKRIAYVGHSYGGMAGGVLSGVEPRISTFVLIGALPSEARHIRENGSPYWQTMRQSMSPGDFARTLEMLHEIDPDQFLPRAGAPILVQCAHFDSDDNVRACPEVFELAGGPKKLLWYEDDHTFTSLEALRDRLAWLQKYLKLRPVGPALLQFLDPKPSNK